MARSIATAGSPLDGDRQDHVAEEAQGGRRVEETAQEPPQARAGPDRPRRPAGGRESGGGAGDPPRSRTGPAREAAEGLSWNAGGVIGMEGRDLEAASREEPAHLAPRECELSELTAGGADPPAPAGQPRTEQPAETVPVGHREQEDTARRQHPRRLGQDRVGPTRIVLDDAQI